MIKKEKGRALLLSSFSTCPMVEADNCLIYEFFIMWSNFWRPSAYWQKFSLTQKVICDQSGRKGKDAVFHHTKETLKHFFLEDSSVIFFSNSENSFVFQPNLGHLTLTKKRLNNVLMGRHIQ